MVRSHLRKFSTRFPIGWGRSLSGVVTHHFGSAHFCGSKPPQEVLHEVGTNPPWCRRRANRPGRSRRPTKRCRSACRRVGARTAARPSRPGTSRRRRPRSRRTASTPGSTWNRNWNDTGRPTSPALRPCATCRAAAGRRSADKKTIRNIIVV